MVCFKRRLLSLLLASLCAMPLSASDKSMFHTLGWVNPNVELNGFLEYPALVQQVYRAHHHQLIWLQIEDQLLIEDMLEMLSLAELFPQFEQRLDALSQLRIQHNYFQYDLIATDTLLMIMSYRARLLENQETWLFGEGIPDLWSNPPQMELDALELAIDNNRLSQFLMQFGGSEPSYRAYQTAIDHLQQRQNEASVDYESDTLIRVGEELPNRELLHIKLELAGLDLSTVDTQKEWYSRDLEKLVKQFQEQHGLQPDGIIGPNTIEWLNYPIEERIRRLALNAERSHLWPTQREALVLVNLPSFELNYFFRGDVAFSSKVIIGKKKRKTPMMAIKMDSMVLNPVWNVPPKIMREDIIPATRRNPEYLSSRGIQVIKGWSDPTIVDHNLIEWNKVNPRTFPYRMRQIPSSANALGAYKFNTPNRRAIYLHDTPSKHLFDKESRAFSSGCIRVQYADKFAHTLSDTQGFRKSNISPIDSDDNTRVALKRRIPVHLIYKTSWVEDGRIHFRDDVYGYDQSPKSSSLASR